MLIISSVSWPLETKDASEAVQKTLDIIRSKVSIKDNITISLGMAAMSFPDILVLLAGALPEEAEGFGMDRSVSAGQFLQYHVAGQLPKPSFCHCDVTDYLSVSDTLKLIESFFQAAPRAIRSTSFTMTFKNLDWRGADGVGSGMLHLSDMKAFRRKQRFHLDANYSCQGKNSKDSSVKKLFRKITGETGIPFDKGRIIETIEKETLAKAEPQQILAARVCFEEAFEQAGLEIRNRNLRWQGLFGLASKHESFNRRFESVFSGKKERVNFPALVRHFMKESFPEFKPCKGDREQIFFSKPISSDLEMVVAFDRIHFSGLGKAFTLLLGIRITEGPLAGRSWDDNLFRLFQQQFPPCWTYVTKVELTGELKGIGGFLKSILPVFEKDLTHYLCPIPTKIPDSIPNRGAITAKQAMEESLNAAGTWAEDAALDSVGSGGLLSLRDGGMGPMIDLNGSLRPHGCWYYSFYSPAKKSTLLIQIPSLGALRCNEFAWPKSFGRTGKRIFPTPFDNWIDTDLAMNIAEENGGGWDVFGHDGSTSDESSLANGHEW